MKWLALALILATGGWGIRLISDTEAVIVNDSRQSITCYIYYYDGDFLKRRIRAYQESRPFPRYNISEVECF